MVEYESLSLVNKPFFEEYNKAFTKFAEKGWYILGEEVDAFEKEYEKFRENPIVDDFLRAELAFCRLMQEVNTYITGELDFQ